MHKVVIITVSILMAFVLIAIAHASDPDAISMFNDVRPSLVIVKSGTGTGSGFIANINGKKRLITNAHVLRGGRPFEAHSVEGQRLRLGSTIYLGDDVDLCMIDIIDSDLPGLSLSTNQPALNDIVYVFGNSDGGGVATVLNGNILGIGPDRIEVSAQFVQGNSGSPIMLSDKTVIGVATYVSRSEDPNDWIKRGTRFSDTRRYGLRLLNVEWISLTPKEYFTLSDAIVDLETFCYDLTDVVFAEKQSTYPYYLYSYPIKKLKYRANVRLCELISDYADALSELEARTEKFIAYGRKYGRMMQYSESSPIVKEGIRLNEARHAAIAKKAKAESNLRRGPSIWISSQNWRTKSLKGESEFWNIVIGLLMQNGHATPQKQIPD